MKKPDRKKHLEEQRKQLEQMKKDLFLIQCDNVSADNRKWNFAYDARKAVSELEHLILQQLGIRK